LSDVILLKSTAAILVAAMFVGDCTMAVTSLAGAAAVEERKEGKGTFISKLL